MATRPGHGEAGAVHLRVSGVVQGVGFRWFVVTRAEELGLTGWTRNLDDGRVEIWAEGGREELGRLVALVREGPRAGRVDAVDVSDVHPTGSHRGFGVRF